MATVKKPSNVTEYKAWHKHTFGESLPTEDEYNLVANQILPTIDKIFWETFNKELIGYEQEFHMKKGCPLLSGVTRKELHIKPYKSFLSKLYRKNIVHKKEENEFIQYKGSFSEIKDIFRTTLVVKYLDGIEYLNQKLSNYNTNCNDKISIDYENRDEGYYALHCCIPIKILGRYDEVSPENNVVWLEIQITTQLQEVLKSLLHDDYAQTRENSIETELKTNWKWDYTSNQFTTNYMGHTLHFMEGLIVKSRNNKGE